ncbi:BrnA antitoxin family protein [Palleronia sp.]|uniref:BrnA antitoxin family protein n=1 Tax=Palleronia sp. TaxID=1940284 RepID=UPI0035C7CCA6
MAKHSKTTQDARTQLARTLRELDGEPGDEDLIRAHCPDAWRTLEEDVAIREKKVHVTLRLDESVAAYYRAMGQGYQARINRVLKAYAQMRIAKVSAIEREAEEVVIVEPPKPAERCEAERAQAHSEAAAQIRARWDELKRMSPEEREAGRVERARIWAEMEARYGRGDAGEVE